MNEAMFGSDASNNYDKEPVDFDSAITPESTVSIPEPVPLADVNSGASSMDGLLGDDAPHPDLMGMMLDGIETVEYPTGSGVIWVRTSPDLPWEPKV